MIRPRVPFWLQESIAVISLVVIVALAIFGAAMYGDPVRP